MGGASGRRAAVTGPVGRAEGGYGSSTRGRGGQASRLRDQQRRACLGRQRGELILAVAIREHREHEEVEPVVDRLVEGIEDARLVAVATLPRQQLLRLVAAAADDEQALTEDIIALAKQHGRYGYRRVTALLCHAGWTVNHKRVERIWRREGLKVPQKQPKRSRLWLNDGSCIRLRPEYPGHVWSYDFVEGRTHDGRKFRILSVIDEASRECLALPVARRLRSEDVLAALAELFVTRGPPAHIRSDNGPEFIANAVQEWLAKIGVKTLYITPGSPWENGYCESFNGSMRDELLNGEIFYTLAEAQILIEAWRRHYNTVRPHSSLGYRPPAPEAATPPWLPSGSASLHLRPTLAMEASMH